MIELEDDGESKKKKRTLPKLCAVLLWSRRLDRRNLARIYDHIEKMVTIHVYVLWLSHSKLHIENRRNSAKTTFTLD